MRFFAALAIMMGFAMSVNAQVINAKAEVVAAVTVSSGNSLDFKNVAPGVIKTVDLKDVVALGTATGGETTGNWTITKGTKTQVTVAIDVPATNAVLKSGATNTLPIAYTGRLRIGTDKAKPDNEINIASFTGTATGSTGAFFEASSFEVDLGGTVTPANDQPSGSYSADITLTATYN